MQLHQKKREREGEREFDRHRNMDTTKPEYKHFAVANFTILQKLGECLMATQTATNALHDVNKAWVCYLGSLHGVFNAIYHTQPHSTSIMQHCNIFSSIISDDSSKEARARQYMAICATGSQREMDQASATLTPEIVNLAIQFFGGVSLVINVVLHTNAEAFQQQQQLDRCISDGEMYQGMTNLILLTQVTAMIKSHYESGQVEPLQESAASAWVENIIQNRTNCVSFLKYIAAVPSDTMHSLVMVVQTILPFILDIIQKVKSGASPLAIISSFGSILGPDLTFFLKSTCDGGDASGQGQGQGYPADEGSLQSPQDERDHGRLSGYMMKLFCNASPIPSTASTQTQYN